MSKRCPQCFHDNAADAAICAACGTSFESSRKPNKKEIAGQAQKALKAGNWAVAAQKLEQLLRLDPHHAQARKILPQVKKKLAAEQRQAQVAPQQQPRPAPKQQAEGWEQAEPDPLAGHEETTKRESRDQKRGSSRFLQKLGKYKTGSPSKGMAGKIKLAGMALAGVVLCAVAFYFYTNERPTPVSSDKPATPPPTASLPPGTAPPLATPPKQTEKPQSAVSPQPTAPPPASITTVNATPLPGQNWTDPHTNMEFVWVAGSCFKMGCGPWSSNCAPEEKPVREICVNDFWIGKYEVTVAQWEKIMADTPLKSKKSDNHPAEEVTWNEAREFINRLNGRSSMNYRLPFEVEWEYAARSGGKEEKYAGGEDLDAVAWYAANARSSQPVGTKQANGLGIHDMSGNVSEWCADWYDAGYYAMMFRNNPRGPKEGVSRVMRGGNWLGVAAVERTAQRAGVYPSERLWGSGFRLALGGKPETSPRQ